MDQDNAVGNDSILGSLKNALNIPSDVDAFDVELIMLINASFAELQQIGVCCENTYQISGVNETWSDFLDRVILKDDDADALRLIYTYMYLDLRLTFDPPTASLLTSMEKRRDELKWRLNVAADRSVERENPDENQ